MVERPEPKSDQIGSSGSDRTRSHMHEYQLVQLWALMNSSAPCHAQLGSACPQIEIRPALGRTRPIQWNDIVVGIALEEAW